MAIGIAMTVALTKCFAQLFVGFLPFVYFRYICYLSGY